MPAKQKPLPDDLTTPMQFQLIIPAGLLGEIRAAAVEDGRSSQEEARWLLRQALAQRKRPHEESRRDSNV